MLSASDDTDTAEAIMGSVGQQPTTKPEGAIESPRSCTGTATEQHVAKCAGRCVQNEACDALDAATICVPWNVEYMGLVDYDLFQCVLHRCTAPQSARVMPLRMTGTLTRCAGASHSTGTAPSTCNAVKAWRQRRAAVERVCTLVMLVPSTHGMVIATAATPPQRRRDVAA